MTSVGVMASSIVAGSGLSGTEVLVEPFTTLTAWATAGTPTIVAGGRTGTTVRLDATADTITYSIPTPSQSDVIIVGFAARFANIGTGARRVLELASDTGATLHNRLGVGTDGAITLTRSTTPVIATSAPSALTTANVWYYLELQVKLHDTAGFVVVRVDGVTVINSATTLDTKNAGTKTVFDTIRFVDAASAVVKEYDDLYVKTGAAETFNGPVTLP